jgi:phosphatidylglycerophosphatase C
MQLAVFDLDGTITRRDTLAPYVFGFLFRHPWRLPRLLGMVPALIRYLFRRDRGALKSALIRSALGGISHSQLAMWNSKFIPALLERGTFRQALEQIAEHNRAADVLVLMSASPDLYVPAIAAKLGFAEAICTGVRWHGDRLDGALTTANRRGKEKTRCLESLCDRHSGLETTAYGNTASDLDYLCRSTRGILVNAPPATRRHAAGLGLRCVSWH